jgi:hypothetical protein
MDGQTLDLAIAFSAKSQRKLSCTFTQAATCGNWLVSKSVRKNLCETQIDMRMSNRESGTQHRHCRVSASRNENNAPSLRRDERVQNGCHRRECEQESAQTCAWTDATSGQHARGALEQQHTLSQGNGLAAAVLRTQSIPSVASTVLGSEMCSDRWLRPCRKTIVCGVAASDLSAPELGSAAVLPFLPSAGISV